MDILNDLTKCNFYYYILRSNKAYLIFKYLQLVGNDICLEDALVRRQKITLDNKTMRYLNIDLTRQYNILNNIFKALKLNQYFDLDQKLFNYSKLNYLLVVQYLVSIGANINAYDDRALRWAAEEGYLQLIQYLVSNKADIHAIDDKAVRYAILKRHLHIVQYLVSKGANIHALDDNALRNVARNGPLNIIQYLVSIGANINVLNAEQKLKYNIN